MPGGGEEKREEKGNPGMLRKTAHNNPRFRQRKNLFERQPPKTQSTCPGFEWRQCEGNLSEIQPRLDRACVEPDGGRNGFRPDG